MALTRKQHTLSAPAEISGKGLFTGIPCTLRILPAEPDSGLRFRRVDLENAPEIPVSVENLAFRQRRTALVCGEAAVETTEHLLSAIHALGLDNLVIEADAAELPAMDGSARDFYTALAEAGVEEQAAEVEAFTITQTVALSEGDAVIVAAPPVGEAEGLDIVYDMDYAAHPAIGRQLKTFSLDALGGAEAGHAYAAEIAPARTFVLDREVEYLRQQGFGLHLTQAELLVIGPEGPIDNALRFPDECVRHKVCDLIGDLRLFGRPLRGRILATRSGHALNQQLVRRLLELAAAPATPVEPSERTPAEKPKTAEAPAAEGADAKPERSARRRGAAAEEADKAPALDIRKILRILPHRYPFLMIDRVLELQPDQRAVGIKNVTFNEPFFQGHYPGQPVMPGVLVLEAMAQLSGILLSRSLDNTNKVALLISMDRVKIRRAARPGDQLVITAESRQVRSRTGYCNCKSTIDGQLSAEAEIKFMLVDEDLT